MKISIITVCWNSEKFIECAINSVLNQTYTDIEYIIVDGMSSDGTLDIIKNYVPKFDGKMKLITEKDNGIYDAMNKGIKIASGDIIGILNSDDFFATNEVIDQIATSFGEEKADAVIGDVVFIKNNSEGRILRRYSSKTWVPKKFAWGFMPPHPSFFAKIDLFQEFGLYNTAYRIAADYDLLIRFFLNAGIRWKYVNITTTKMRMGGASTRGLKSLITLNQEIRQACKNNGVFTNYAMIYSKYLFKPFEFLFND